MWNKALLLHPAAQAMFTLFGGRIRLVGGCVRDAWLGRPLGDMDMASALPPDETMAVLEREGFRVIPTGLAHGTITALVGEFPVEITSLRKDISCDGRRAAVAFTGNWQEDALRRDFTMNALYLAADGTLSDYFGGAEDARAGRVRFIGDATERLREDGLRILRFFRFNAYFGAGEMDASGLAACVSHKAMLGGLSGERIASEMLKLLAAPRPQSCLEIMQREGILSEIQLENVAPFLEQIPASSPLVRLAACFAPETLDALATRWKLSCAQTQKLRAWKAPPLARLSAMDAAERKASIRRMGKQDYIAMTYLAQAQHGEDLSSLRSEADGWEIPQFPVNGKDLLARGFSQGKALGEKLAALEAIWEASGYHLTKEELLNDAS